jgi:two-component system, cell cycle sensor histidine kinase and response regulator CckA
MNQRHMGLQWKIGATYAAMTLALSILAIAAIYWVTDNILREQLEKRAVAIATSFSDAAAGHLTSNNLLAVHALARKYTLLDGAAYAFVEDSQGEVVAHTLGTFPDELRRELSPPPGRQLQQRQVMHMGRAVYETAMPVLEGQLGVVHVGFWADAVETEIRAALVPIIAILAAVPLVGAILSFLVAHRLVRPIVGLTKIADKITMGDLETAVMGEYTSYRNEIGDLARSLERMRSSLKAAILRLARELA